jgi:hypothetical protein
MDRYIYVELVRTSMKIGEGKKQCMLRTQILTVDLLKRYFRIPFIQGKV